MDQNEKNRIHNNLTIQLQNYIVAIIKKYGKYIPKERLELLNSIDDFKRIIKIYEYGSVNAYANNKWISMPLCADKLFKIVSKVPGYGINKKHQTYNSETLINNSNTFMDYIIHVFISGTNVEGYYDDMLLHETMHFCGSGGATALKEGINELLTRKVALENGFRTNGCAYPKEVQVALQLQNIFGVEIIDQIAFINSEQEIYEFLAKTINIDAAELYVKVSSAMEKEFSNKYYSYMDSYDGIMGIMRKTLNYRKINYSAIHDMINEYAALHQECEQQGTKNIKR